MKRRIERGDSLIEVMIALSLTAVTALGMIAVQSALGRSERVALERERAAFIANSVAEGVRADADRVAVLSQWQPKAASMLREGEVAIFDRADGVRIATVSWHARGRSEPCPEPQAKPLASCVVVAFAR